MRSISWKKVTGIGIIAVTFGAIVYDIFMVMNDQKHDTISEVIRTAAKKMLLVPFAFGLLMGHFFWPLMEDKNA